MSFFQRLYISYEASEKSVIRGYVASLVIDRWVTAADSIGAVIRLEDECCN